MYFSKWLDAREGRAKQVAGKFGVSKSAVSQWKRGVPFGLMEQIRDHTEGQVSLEEMLQERASRRQAEAPQ